MLPIQSEAVNDNIHLVVTSVEINTVESTTEINSTTTTPRKMVSTVPFFENFDPFTFVTCIVVCVVLSLIFNGLFHYFSSRPRSRPPEIDTEKQAKVPRNKNNSYTNVGRTDPLHSPLLIPFSKKLSISFKSKKVERIEMDRYSTKPSPKPTLIDSECIYDDIADINGEPKWPTPPPSLLINGDGYNSTNPGQHSATPAPITLSNLPEDIYDDIGISQNNSNWQNSLQYNQREDEIYDDIGHEQPQGSCYVEEELYDDVVNLRPHYDSRNDDRNTIYEPVSEENVYVN